MQIHMSTVEEILATTVDYVWGLPLQILLLGGGAALLAYSRFLPFLGLKYVKDILAGRFDNREDPGEITHFQAVSTALASTVGLGNIGGVAIAVTQGGPGALFWMWMAAIVGMATKFFTCTLAVMYRGKDSKGRIQGGPMYYIEEGLGKSFRPFSVFFSLCGVIGCLSLFQANQMAEILSATYQVPRQATGIIAVLVVSIVILGGVKRIARVASGLVPAMCLLYLMVATYIVIVNIEHIPSILSQIFTDAFTGTAAAGGAAGIGVMTVIRTGVKRAAFSNEAGIGTAPMAHGAAKTNEPVREGLVAMVEPFVDTVMICSLTAIVILSSGAWREVGEITGVALTANAFEGAMGPFGKLTLVIIVICFGSSTMFGYSYYGRKCFSYLFGAEKAGAYDLLYLGSLYAGAVWTAGIVVNLIDTFYALMTFPNMIAALLLAPKVMKATRVYLSKRQDSLSSPIVRL
jgi:AGCS family alanine or glycine:cation symporter